MASKAEVIRERAAMRAAHGRQLIPELVLLSDAEVGLLMVKLSRAGRVFPGDGGWALHGDVKARHGWKPNDTYSGLHAEAHFFIRAEYDHRQAQGC